MVVEVVEILLSKGCLHYFMEYENEYLTPHDTPN